jgi:hypothetical protein
MFKQVCDKCGIDIKYGFNDIKDCTVWDQSFMPQYDGVIWGIEVKGNYMNSEIHVCKNCAVEGLELLVKRNPKAAAYLVERVLNEKKNK